MEAFEPWQIAMRERMMRIAATTEHEFRNQIRIEFGDDQYKALCDAGLEVQVALDVENGKPTAIAEFQQFGRTFTIAPLDRSGELVIS